MSAPTGLYFLLRHEAIDEVCLVDEPTYDALLADDAWPHGVESEAVVAVGLEEFRALVRAAEP